MEIELLNGESAEELFRSLLEATPDAMVITNKEGQITFINTQTQNIFGYTRKELIGQKVEMLIPQKFVSNHYKHRANFQSNPKLRIMGASLNLWGLRKDRTEFPVEISLSPLKTKSSMYIIAAVRDISDKKKSEALQKDLENKLQQSKRMESLGVLAGGIAHDLNNLLGPILAYPDLILSDLPTNTPVKNDLLMIKGAAYEASNIINDMLTLARRGKYSMVPVNLNDIVNSFFQSAKVSELNKNNTDIEIEFNLADDLKNIKGSKTHLLKVVMNLIINAFEAIEKGKGKIVINTYTDNVKSQALLYDDIERGRYSVLTIADTGKGIKEEDLPHIFEPFYSKKKMGISGSGLGLSIVLGIVKDHGGYIDISAGKKKGTKFSLFFPDTDSDEKISPKDTTKLEGNESILVVDDESKQRQVADRVLSSLGYDVKTLSTIAGAIEYLKNNEVELVILDMVMESEDAGLKLYEKIREFKPDQKAIIVSGFSKSNFVKKALKLGVGSYTGKPYTVGLLGKVVREELDKNN